MNNTIEHKGYVAVLSFDFEDNCIYGDVVGTSDKLFFEAETPAEAKENFESLIEEYLSACEQKGKSPEKPYNGVWQIRATPEIHKGIAYVALKKGIKLNSATNEALEMYIAAQNEQGQTIHKHDHVHHNFASVTNNFVAIGSGDQITQWRETNYANV